MTSGKFKQLNPFELKSAISDLLNKINSVNDIQNCLADFDMLEAQEDKKLISKVLFKELVNSSQEKIPIICFLLEHYVEKEELINKLWETLKNPNLQTEVKITILNLLRDMDSDWTYESCEEYLDDASSLLDANTKQLLNTAIINPEVQIDFMDFLATIRVQDKITLINSFAEDFTSDILANILIPVFVSDPDSAIGKEALKLLGTTKSQLALHVLEEMVPIASGELLQEIKRSLSTIKISGMRQDNTKEFYKEILSNSKPYKFYITYPDGHGDQAMIFTRITEDERIRFVSIVTNVEAGIRDCFGFFDISKFECSKILEKFLKDEKTIDISPETFKTILLDAESKTIRNNHNTWKLPYEYVCWKNLLIDIDYDSQPIEQTLKEMILPAKVDSTIFKKLSNMKISTHWFMDYQYSDEFQELLKKLNTEQDLEKLIEENLEFVFYDAEKQAWYQKLIIAAFIKYSIGKDNEASEIYGLSQNDALMNDLYRNILQQSIYEYLLVIKYNKDIERFGLTLNNINDKIKYIEDKWVQHV